MKSKRTYKIIACVSIWLSVIIAFFTLAIAKPKAGVIVEQSPVEYLTEYLTTENYESGLYLKTVSNILSSGSAQVFNVYINNTSSGVYEQRGTLSIIGINQEFTGIMLSYHAFNPSAGGQGGNIGPFQYIINDNFIYILLDDIFTDILSLGNNQTLLQGKSIQLRPYSQTPVFYKMANAIAAAQNIYDLQKNDVVLIYLSDISGLDTTAYRDEITINWGYIDSNDNTIYRVHAPTIGAQRTNDNIISLEMPINAAGDATSYYSIDQSVILSALQTGTGGATATAHIYGIYVWIQQSYIQWGLAEFDTSGLPASNISMNYITSLTNLYDYTATNTTTMTCRLSISNNFNFITIKNQPILSAYNINTVIQQGGFMPAWAVYNWAEGTRAGYRFGEVAGAATYQPGGIGYEEIFQAGRRAGIEENVGTVNWFVSAFNAVDAMLNIRIFPNITIGYLVGIPFVISVVWFIIRMFRGGGSSS